MPYSILPLCLVMFLATKPMNFVQDAKKDVDKIQGTWAMAQIVRGGKTVSDKEATDKAKVIFAGEKMTISGEGRERNFTFKLNEDATPKSIDLTALDGTFKGETNPGIYRFEGETMQLCLPNVSSKDRPKDFAAPEGSIVVLITLKREKK
jgi:uncharacterized protein (TIGR03067 family)